MEVLKRIGNASYKVAQAWMKIHQVIHVSNLKPYHQDPNDKHRNNIVRPSIDLKPKKDTKVEEIFAERVRKFVCDFSGFDRLTC